MRAKRVQREILTWKMFSFRMMKNESEQKKLTLNRSESYAIYISISVFTISFFRKFPLERRLLISIQFISFIGPTLTFGLSGTLRAIFVIYNNK